MYNNSKILKTFIALAVAVILAFPACADSFDTEAAHILQSFDIIDNVPYEDLNLENTITRAEFAKVVTRVLGYGNMEGFAIDSYYSDVPADYWASSHINLCTSLGIFEGSGNGLFRPEEGVLLQDAVKTMVTVLGYKVVAQEGGYPDGYISQAAKLGLLKDISAGFETEALRSDVFLLVYNALDVDKLTLTLSANNEQSYQVSKGETIRNYLSGMGDIFEGTGIITSNFETFLIESSPVIETDEVEIDGTTYKIGTSDAKNYIGVKVDFAAYEDKKTGDYVLKYVMPERNVEILDIDSNEFNGYESKRVSYYKNEKSTAKALISESAVILYNNRPITDWEQFNIKNGDIRLIDNDGNNIYDVVMIRDYISLPVESVNTEDKLIKFKDSALYNNASAILFDVYDDDYRMVAYNAQGEEIGIEDIKSDSLISIFADSNREYMKIVTSDEKAEGIITDMLEDGCVIDGETYLFEEGTTLSEDVIRAGDSVVLYLNFEGKVGYIDLIENETNRYGYIIGADTQGFDNTTVYIAVAGKMEKRVDNLDNDPESNNTVTILVSNNSSVEELKLAKKYTVRDQYGNALRFTDSSDLPCGEVVKFRTNSEGELSDIFLPEMLDGANDMTYNARDNVFGKGYSTPFGIDDETVVLCVPENKSASLDDYLAQVEMENGQQYTVCGYDFNQHDSNVKLLMIEEEMNFESMGGIGVNTSIAIVEKVSKVLDDNGIPVTKLTLLTKEMGAELNKTINVASYADEAKISKLKVGDVIYYSQNANRELVDYKSVASLGKDMNYTSTGEGTANEVVYGRLYSIVPGQIDVLMNRRAYEMVIQTDEYNPSKARTIYPHTSNSPPVFIYDKEAKTITFGSLDMAISAEISAGNSDNIFAYLKNNTVEGIVLVRNSDSGR